MKLTAIKENHLYSKAYTKGKKYVGRYVVIYILPDYKAAKLAKENPRKEKINRVGITVTKKLGSAVVRNRAKRVIREGYVAASRRLEVKKGFLVVIVARGAVVKAKAWGVEADIAAALNKLSMVKKEA